MLKVGVTGGIGSGKTTVCKIFESLGIPVFYADSEAKKLTANADVKEEIIRHFGSDMYDGDKMKRDKMASLVFGNPEKLSRLNSIIHPAVGKAYREWLLANNNHPYTLKEAAILFETDSYKNLDKIIVVSAPDELRIKRVMERDQVSRQSVLDRMKKQWPQEKLIEKSDFHIVNDEENLLIPQVMKIHKQILSL